MSTIVNWYDENNKQTFLSWFLLRVMSEAGDINKFGPFPENSENMVVEMKINGIEVDPVQIINQIEAQFDQMIEDKAREMIGKKFNKIINLLDDLEGKVQEEIGISED